jgi:hypothetical protein
MPRLIRLKANKNGRHTNPIRVQWEAGLPAPGGHTPARANKDRGCWPAPACPSAAPTSQLLAPVPLLLRLVIALSPSQNPHRPP